MRRLEMVNNMVVKFSTKRECTQYVVYQVKEDQLHITTYFVIINIFINQNWSKMMHTEKFAIDINGFLDSSEARNDGKESEMLQMYVKL